MKKNQQKIITLTTDFGNDDNYVSCMKGVILSINPYVNIVDNTHNLDSFDVEKAAFNIFNMYGYYPAGTIHVAVVDPGVGSRRRSIIVSADEYYFVGPDNGIFGYIIEKCRHVIIYSATNDDYYLPQPSSTFHGRDIFAPVASHLSLGITPDKFGRRISNYKKLNFIKPSVKNNKMTGKIIYRDKFGNLVTNIESHHAGKILNIKIDNIVIPRLSKTYSDVKKGEFLALIGSSGFLEISINRGSAADVVNSNTDITCFFK